MFGLGRIRRFIRQSSEQTLLMHFAATQPQQRLLWLHYRDLVARGGPLPPLPECGFRVYSQMEEDGLLLLILAAVGAPHRTCIEVAFGSALGSNTANLICNLGWSGLLIEGDPARAEAARRFFASHPDTWVQPPIVVCEWLDATNLNRVCEENGFREEIDLLSIDVDGIDYWILRNLEAVRPRVIVVEVANRWGPEDSYTVPDAAEFQGPHEIAGDFAGASLLAFVRMGIEKGYRLVGANRCGINAFFVREDLAEDLLPAVSVASCLDNPKSRAARAGAAESLGGEGWMRV